MSDMKKVEASICKNDAIAAPTLDRDPPNYFVKVANNRLTR
jgi:hypothetical protein